MNTTSQAVRQTTSKLSRPEVENARLLPNTPPGPSSSSTVATPSSSMRIRDASPRSTTPTALPAGPEKS